MDYSKFQQSAVTKIAQYGQPVVIHKSSDSIYDPIKGEMTSQSIDETVYAVMTSPSEKDYEAGLYKHGDAVLLLDAVSISSSPTTDDTVTVNNEEWKVIAVQRVQPAESAILYKLVIRRA